MIKKMSANLSALVFSGAMVFAAQSAFACPADLEEWLYADTISQIEDLKMKLKEGHGKQGNKLIQDKIDMLERLADKYYQAVVRCR